MVTKKLIRSNEEWLNFVKEEFIRPMLDDKPVWREEDMPLLEPFFNSTRDRETPMRMRTDEEQASYEHYLKCREEYADAAFAKRDSMEQFDLDELVDYFGCRWDVPDDTEEDYNIDELAIHPDFDQQWPAVMVLRMDSSNDRLGDIKMFFMDFVEQTWFHQE